MQPLDLPLRFTQGDDAQVHLTFVTPVAEPFDLTEWTVTAVIRKRADPDLAPLASFAVVQTANEVTLTLEEEDTLALPERAYWSLRAFHSSSDLVQTWLAGLARTDFRAEDAGANAFTIEIGPTEVTVVTAAGVGPIGPKGDDGQQGTSGLGVPPGGTTAQVLAKVSDDDYDTDWATGGGGGAPTDATYLTATSNGGLSAEVVVGATPGGELGGTWASPTVDATHSGSAHLALGSSGSTAAAGNHDHAGTYDPAGTSSTHSADTTSVHGIADTADVVLTDDARLSNARTPTAHVLNGALHTASGLTAGHVLRASGATAFDFAALQDADIPSTIARDSEVAAGYQPLDSDLTAIAALSTTSYGRALLALADAAAGRTALGLGTAATSASGDFQPIDSDLTSIAALSTTSYGRSLLEAADAAAARTLTGAPSTTDARFDRFKRIASTAPTITATANTTAKSTVASLTLPAADVAVDDVFVFEVGWDALNNSGGAVNYTYTLDLGASQLAVSNALSVSTSSARIKGRARFSIYITATAAQRTWGDFAVSFAGAQSMPAWNTGQTGVVASSTTENLSTDKTLVFSITMGTANANADFRPYVGVLTRMR